MLKKIVTSYMLTKVLSILILLSTIPTLQQSFASSALESKDQSWTPPGTLETVINHYTDFAAQSPSQAPMSDKPALIREPKTIYTGPTFDPNEDVLLEKVNRRSISRQDLQSNPYAHVRAVIQLQPKPTDSQPV